MASRAGLAGSRAVRAARAARAPPGAGRRGVSGAPGAPVASDEAGAAGRGLGVGFSGGGLLLPYLAGAAAGLSRPGLPGAGPGSASGGWAGPPPLGPETPLAGSSAGSLTAMALAAGVPMEQALELTIKMVNGLRPGWMGAFGLKDPLRALLEELLPPDIHRRASGRVHVGIVWLADPSYRWELVSDFSSRADVIEALLASCHVPFWFDGRNATTQFRGRAALDGGLSPNFMPSPPGCDRPVRVSCIPNLPAADIAPGVLTTAGFSVSEAITFALSRQPEKIMRDLYVQGGVDAAEWRRRLYEPRLLGDPPDKSQDAAGAAGSP